MRAGIVGIVILGLASAFAASANAQAINPNKDCQTIVNCRFVKGGSFRGCVSSFSCRQCRFVATRCKIAGRNGTCRKLKCGWGS